LGRVTLLFLNGAILSVCAVFIESERALLLTGLMLFLPLLDRTWDYRKALINRSVNAHLCKEKKWLNPHTKPFLLASLFITGLIIITVNPDYRWFALTSLLLTALPEEWFFRAYFMTRIEGFFRQDTPPASQVFNALLFKDVHKKYPNLSANILTSSLFALLHTPTQGWFGLMVFFPSLFYGWAYQKTRNLLLVILLHALSNIVFVIYISDLIHWRS